MKKVLILVLVFGWNLVSAQNLVTVTGEGLVKVMPDRAVIKVRVENQGTSAKEVQTLNNQSVDAVLKSLKSLKLDAKYISTEMINLNKNYNYETKEYFYVANQAIVIFLEDLKMYEPVMNKLLDSGVNRIDDVNFLSSDMEKLMSASRKKAMENAKKKALDYVEVLGQKLGKAKTISETEIHRPRPMYDTMLMKGASQESQQTIAVGEMEIRTQVNVAFELE